MEISLGLTRRSYLISSVQFLQLLKGGGTGLGQQHTRTQNPGKGQMSKRIGNHLMSWTEMSVSNVDLRGEADLASQVGHLSETSR